jgi:hypothetical protein
MSNLQTRPPTPSMAKQWARVVVGQAAIDDGAKEVHYFEKILTYGAR